MNSTLDTLKLEIPKSRIVVAMSGGIDSSTVAGILHEQGHEVIGITLQLYDYSGVTKKGTCCAGQDIYDAKLASEYIGIPHYVFNYESKFKQKVIDNFVDSYLHGETPIPCVQCNMSVKFTDLIKAAKELEANFLATGHYVQKIFNQKIQKNELHRGFDVTKDQSYFLFQTTQEQLDYLLFPLGGITKQETRLEAKRLGLAIHDKPDSQDICFVPDGNYAKVIEKYQPNTLKTGKILHIDGFILGEHLGIHHYTIGQRRGLKISYEYPLYVIKIDPNTNIIYVGPESSLEKTTFFIKDVNFLEKIDFDTEYLVKLRSLHHGCLAKITLANEFDLLSIAPSSVTSSSLLTTSPIYKIELSSMQKSITPGQACVIYDQNKIVGGGWIMRT